MLVFLQLQGSIMVGSLFQVFVGFSGLIGFFMRFIGPLTIAPTISLIGLSLFDSAGTKAGHHWGISGMWVTFPHKGVSFRVQVDLQSESYYRYFSFHDHFLVTLHVTQTLFIQ